MIALPDIGVTVSDAVQIGVLHCVFYTVLKYARGSRFGQALTGVGIIAAVLFGCTFVFDFKVLTGIIKMLLVYLAVSSVVIFQPEIRRLLPALGSLRLFGRSRWEQSLVLTPQQLADSLIGLSRRKLGALVAIERGISLRAYMDSGIPLDSIATPELLYTIFTPPLPLHDGGVIIRDGRIAAAHCLFPVSKRPELVVSGMRHRAAVGLTEETDALVIVVSEETGRIAIAHNGKLHRYDDGSIRRVLVKWIHRAQYGLSTAEDRLARMLSTDHPVKAAIGRFSLKHFLFHNLWLKLLAATLACLVYFSWRSGLVSHEPGFPKGARTDAGYHEEQT